MFGLCRQTEAQEKGALISYLTLKKKKHHNPLILKKNEDCFPEHKIRATQAGSSYHGVVPRHYNQRKVLI